MMEPVARIDAEALKELEKHPEAAATVWSGKARNQFAKGAVPLVRLSDAEARVKELEAAYENQQRANVYLSETITTAEARAEAAEALLKEIKTKSEAMIIPDDKLSRDLVKYAVQRGRNLAARAIHDKIGVKDE